MRTCATLPATQHPGFANLFSRLRGETGAYRKFLISSGAPEAVTNRMTAQAVRSAVKRLGLRDKYVPLTTQF